MSTITLNPVLQLRRVFDATPEELFDAWFDREQWQAWIGPEGCQCDVPLLEPKVGGRYRIAMHLSDGRQIPVEGEFQIVDRPRALAFTWGWALAGGSTVVRLSFKAVEGGTELTLIHEGLAKAEDREGHGKGWNSALNKLARFVKGETP
ncbi:MAG TPA: SRPBCC domain-containing protein [Rhizomicrobium sp.]|nr:SRPBCC domain-containing protein [Rhizomicrobium sp.]